MVVRPMYIISNCPCICKYRILP